MHQRITDLVNHRTVKLSLFTGHIQLYGFVEFLGKIPDHTRELGNNRLNRYHSNLHHGLMKVCGHTFKIFNMVIKLTVIAAQARCRTNKRIFGNDKLADKVHQ